MSKAIGMNELTNDANELKRKAKQRKRSIAIALALLAMVVMFYITAWVRFGNVLGS